MAPCTAPDRVLVRSGQTLDYAGLQAEARDAVRETGLTQAEVAARLGVTQGVVSHALRDGTGRYAGTQRRIIEELTGYRIEDETRVVFRVVKKAAGA